MTRQVDHFLVKVLTGSFMALVLAVNGFSLIYHNGAGSGYGGAGSGEKAAAPVSLEYYIVEGAGYFLQGCSDVQALLNYVERGDLEGMDFPGLQQSAAGALENFTRAKRTYKQLIAAAEATPYNHEFQARLKGFAYHAFMVKHRLNRVVFREVAGHLSRGDITGIFKASFSHLKGIEGLLVRMNNDIAAYRVPALRDCWQLNEWCANAALFGSYPARVFQAIKAK